jgi:ribosome maturation factor RimP
MKYSKIIIAQGDLVLILAGDDTNRLQARRKTQNQEITLKVSLNKDGTMDIEKQENISERIDPKKTRTLKR